MKIETALSLDMFNGLKITGKEGVILILEMGFT